MPARLRPLLLVLCVAVLACRACAEDTAAQKEVRERRVVFIKAFNSHKLDDVIAFYDKSFKNMPKDGDPRDLDEEKEALTALFKIPGLKVTSDSAKIDVTGDTAVVITADTISFTDEDGKTQTDKGASRETWKKVDGKWLLAKNEDL